MKKTTTTEPTKAARKKKPAGELKIVSQIDQKALLRTMVRGAYDLQKLRIEQGNRLVAQFKSKLGHKPGTKEEDSIDEEGLDMLRELKASFKKVTTGVARELPSKADWKGDELISTYTEACLLAQYVAIERAETNQFRRLESVLEEFPIYNEFLIGVRGCGPAMSAVLISEIDITKATYVSSLWKFAGLDVVKVGDEEQGRSRRREHLRQIKYINKDGQPAERVGITFNAWLKTKVVGVLGGCLIKSNSQPYRKIYDDYKSRLENHPKWKEKTKAHRHNAALRYMAKMFLMDLYAMWRPLEGLPAHKPYAESKLGIVHSKAA